MQRFSFYIPFCLLLFFTSCDECRFVECLDQFGTIEASFLKDGEDVLFGNNPLVSLDSFQLVYENDQDVSPEFTIDTIKQIVIIPFYGSEALVIIAPGLNQQILAPVFTKIEEGECCDDFDLTAITLDETIVCNRNCEEEMLIFNLE